MEFLAFVASPRLTNLTSPHCLVTLHCVDSPHFLTSLRIRLALPHPHCVLVSDWLVVPASPHRKPINTGTPQHSAEKQECYRWQNLASYLPGVTFSCKRA